MVLKEWADVWKLYKDGHGYLIKTLNDRAPRFKWTLLIIAIPSAVIILYGMVTTYLWGWTTGTRLMVIIAWVVALVVLVLFVPSFNIWRIIVLGKVFKDEYKQHRIGDHSFFKREQYLRYAFFLRGLVERAWSHDDITRLRRFAETLRKPAPAFQIAQHPLVVPFVTVVVGLLLEVFKQQEPWKSGLVMKLLGISQALVFVILPVWIYRMVTFTIPNNMHQEIERFLQWAEMDIKEQKSKDTVSG